MKKQIVTNFLIIAFLTFGVSKAAFSDPKVKIKSETRVFNKTTGIFIHTVVLENTGDMDATDYRVTSQPYSTRKEDKDGDGKPDGAAVKQEQKNITVKAGSTKKLFFLFQGANDGKNWRWKYTDVYSTDNDKDRVDQSIGAWTTEKIQPQSGGSIQYQLDLLLPYPDTIVAIDGGATDFFLDIVGSTLPPDWFFDISPTPGDIFTLSDINEMMSMLVTFTAPSETFAGDLALVNLDYVHADTGFRVHSQFGIQVVSEPPLVFLIGLALMIFLRMRSPTSITSSIKHESI